MRIDQVHLLHQQRHQPALRIEVEPRRQPQHLITQILMQQMNRTHANAEKEDRLPQLEQANQKQAPVVNSAMLFFAPPCFGSVMCLSSRLVNLLSLLSFS